MDTTTLQQLYSNNAKKEERFALPYTFQQSREFLTIAYRGEVEKRGAYPYTSTPEIDKNLDALAKWLTTSTMKPGIILAGTTPGTGKTTTARALVSLLSILQYHEADEERKKQIPCFRFIEAADLERMYMAMAATRREHPGENEYYAVKDYNQLVATPHVLLDDIGTERRTVKDYGIDYEPFISFVQDRYNAGHATSITTNFSMTQIAEVYGQRVVDRLREGCEVLAFNGASFRK